jgi:hypothetical protein
MPRRQSPLEANWPTPEDFVALARRWRSDAIEILLGYVWVGYDLLKEQKLRFDPRQEDLEREITQLLVPRIRDAMSGAEPFYAEHGPFETETRHSAKAQPPQYDLGFVMRANPRAIWPLEAKVLKTDEGVAEYVKDVRGAFLEIVYAPFSSEAAMLGYLLKGSPGRTFTKIAGSLGCQLEEHSHFAGRDHRCSRHIREVPIGKTYPSGFTCHHLIFLFS